MAPLQAGSATEVLFEVHALRAGRWVIDAMTPDEAEAHVDAQEIMRRDHVEGVRVIKEIRKPAQELSAARVIFEQLRPRPKRAGPTQPRPPIRQPRLAAPKKARPEAPHRARPRLLPAAPESAPWRAYLVALGVLAIAAGAVAYSLAAA